MLTRLMPVCLLTLFAPSLPVSAADDLPELERLHAAVSELVTRHYPDATSHVFRNRIHFEHNTRIYVIPGLVKTPIGEEPPLVEERGPLPQGVHCDIRWYAGPAATARAEGTLDRRAFRELFLAPSSGMDSHLLVVLRIPASGERVPDRFLMEFEALVRGFDRYLGAE